MRRDDVLLTGGGCPCGDRTGCGRKKMKEPRMPTTLPSPVHRGEFRFVAVDALGGGLAVGRRGHDVGARAGRIVVRRGRRRTGGDDALSDRPAARRRKARTREGWKPARADPVAGARCGAREPGPKGSPPFPGNACGRGHRRPRQKKGHETGELRPRLRRGSMGGREGGDVPGDDRRGGPPP